jgi:putative nucleotidyltransferase with HDIG domain
MNKSDLGQLRNWFFDYVNRYSAADPDGREAYELKIGHSLMVVDNCTAIGQSLDLDVGDIALAETIGLFHDIGRFEQFRRYHTFMDGKSENHASLGVAVLRESKTLSLLDEDDQKLILIAVSCHNLLRVPAALSRREDLFCRLIRDADKIDIMGVVTAYYESGEKSEFIELNLPDEPVYSEEILDDLFANRLVDMKKMRTLNDFKLLQLGWVYDLNFPQAARMISEKRYLEAIRKSLPASDAIDELLTRLNRHIDAM